MCNIVGCTQLNGITMIPFFDVILVDIIFKPLTFVLVYTWCIIGTYEL